MLRLENACEALRRFISCPTQNKHRIRSAAHLCVSTPLCWAAWLPWPPSPDMPLGPPSALWRWRREASFPSSSSQEWLATDRKPLTESSESESAGRRRPGAPGAGSCRACRGREQTNTHGTPSSGERQPKLNTVCKTSTCALLFLLDCLHLPLLLLLPPTARQTPPGNRVPMRGYNHFLQHCLLSVWWKRLLPHY